MVVVAAKKLNTTINSDGSTGVASTRISSISINTRSSRGKREGGGKRECSKPLFLSTRYAARLQQQTRRSRRVAQREGVMTKDIESREIVDIVRPAGQFRKPRDGRQKFLVSVARDFAKEDIVETNETE
ncbi:hypothetical protein BIW11_04950 [Tropilaelaps mercedesae]|uniref:Uncharacterized protein n=1 Tax=Tropilaelaps mercedesae TaxID=418985 RepID=A0A1V9WZN9_9ACAR|nr:hypothetical protein BIW11_04950 [Tropilaelaps mercedesae]